MNKFVFNLKKIFEFSIILIVIASQNVFAETDRVNQAVETLRTLCLAGESFELKFKGDGKLSLLKQGASGEIIFSKSEKRGVVDGLEGALKTEELENIRDCIEPRIDRILDYLLIDEQSKKIIKVTEVISNIPFPQLWEGRYEVNSNSYSFRLNIERIDNDVIIGSINWPDFGNIVTSMEGHINKNFNLEDFDTESKWRLIRSAVNGSKGGMWVTFTDTAFIRGSYSSTYSTYKLKYEYYAYVNKNGLMRGVVFKNGGRKVHGKFTLYLQP